MEILITNDDGVLAEGLRVLRHALEPLGRVWVVAPEREQSATSHALTIHRPLRVRRLEEGVLAVDGTPTDCVLLACRGIPGLLEVSVDLVVSGINHGANAGDDVAYSGTVAAAVEGRMMGRPAMAISLDDWEPGGFEAAGEVARLLASKVVASGAPSGSLLNVNVPSPSNGGIRGYRVTRLGKRVYSDRIVAKTDPRGRPYYWIGGEEPAGHADPGTDIEAIEAGFVSVTPIRLDWTDDCAFSLLRGWDLPDGEER